jgi:hypothetical protein
MKREQTEMAKSQRRSNREVRKPKAVKTAPAAIAVGPASPVRTLMQKPKGKI